MTWFRWWHRYVRMVTKPKPQHVAEKWYKKLSVLYMFFAWNAAGLVIYKMVEASRFKTLTEEQKQGLSKGRFPCYLSQFLTVSFQANNWP